MQVRGTSMQRLVTCLLCTACIVSGCARHSSQVKDHVRANDIGYMAFSGKEVRDLVLRASTQTELRGEYVVEPVIVKTEVNLRVRSTASERPFTFCLPLRVLAQGPSTEGPAYQHATQVNPHLAIVLTQASSKLTFSITRCDLSIQASKVTLSYDASNIPDCWGTISDPPQPKGYQYSPGRPLKLSDLQRHPPTGGTRSVKKGS